MLEDEDADTESNMACVAPFKFEVSDFTRLRRLVFLGTGGDSTESKHLALLAAAELIVRLVFQSGTGGTRVIDFLDAITTERRAAKPDVVCLALAVCIVCGTGKVKQAAWKLFPRVCAIPTTLFMFLDLMQKINTLPCVIAINDPIGEHKPTKNWGRATQRAVRAWYTEKKPMHLALLVTKYAKREGWSHADVLALCHLKTAPTGSLALIKAHVCGKPLAPRCPERTALECYEMTATPPANDTAVSIHAMLTCLTSAATVEQVCANIATFHLSREHVPTELLIEPSIWRALLPTMGGMAIFRNLGKLTSVGVLDESASVDLAVKKMHDAKAHPVQILIALKQYGLGKGDKGGMTWTPNARIENALEALFPVSFAKIEPLDMNVVIGLDVSGSMTMPMKNMPCMTSAEAAAALVLVLLRCVAPGRKVTVLAFTSTVTKISFTSDMTVAQIMRKTAHMSFGATDVAQPMIWATEHKLADVGLFVTLSDNETNSGRIPSTWAIKNYREKLNVPAARLVVVAMDPSGYTTVDKNDPGMFDLEGFDAGMMPLISDIAHGRV